jgi:hypothetical protein
MTDDDDSAQGGKKKASPSQATLLVRLAEERYRLGQSESEEPFAVPIAGPNVARMLRGTKSLRAELSRRYYQTYGTTPASNSLTDALLVLEGKAMTSPPEPVAVRVARCGNALILDLAHEDGTVAVITAGGWRLTQSSPVLFRRTRAMAALPQPSRDGGLHPLRLLLNVNDKDWPLIPLWLVAALFPDIAHAVLFFIGEQGSAKSWAGRLCSAVIDPSPAQLRRPPTDQRDWQAQANASWVVTLDNLSYIPPWLSDALCRACTGDGSIDRTLYTNTEITVTAFRRVIALTSIGVGGLRGDLADRSMLIELESIDDDERKEDTEIAGTFARQHARILGGVLDLAARVLQVLPAVAPTGLTRMADFHRTAAALDKVGSFGAEDAYRATVKEALTAVVEHDVMALALSELLKKGNYDGTVGDALDQLTKIITQEDPIDGKAKHRPPKYWPKTPRGLTEQLKRLAAPLRAVGITIIVGERTTRGRGLQVVRESTDTTDTTDLDNEGTLAPEGF